MTRRAIIYLLFLPLLFSCKKENERPQWDIEVLGPVIYATLGINELMGDSTTGIAADGSVVIEYDSTISLFELDSLYDVKDTSYRSVVLFPPFPGTVFPGTPFASNNNNINLNPGSVLLKKAIISSGKIRIDIKNTLRSKINFTYLIPGALKDGVPFTVVATVDSASPSDPKYFSSEYDLSGYELDLRGASGNTFNTIYYNVNVLSDPNGYPPGFPVGPSDTIVNLTTTLIGVQPYFVSGYLGQGSLDANGQLNLNSFIRGGMVELDSIKLNMDFLNYIGAEAQGYISNLFSVNDRTLNVVQLNAPGLINQQHNLNRATLTGNPAAPSFPSVYSLQLDNSNSNVIPFIENLPTRLSYNVDFSLNPLGNISGSNDFVYSDSLVYLKIALNMPLRFALNQLLLADTVPFSISNATDFDPIGPATLTLIAENGFPLEMDAQLFLIDSVNMVTDSLLMPGLIAAADVDAAYRATGSRKTVLTIPVDGERKQRLLSVKQIGLRFTFTTPDFPQIIRMYPEYKLKLKLVADGTYSIR